LHYDFSSIEDSQRRVFILHYKFSSIFFLVGIMSDIMTKDPYSTLPAYDPDNFSHWKFYFTVYIRDLNDIITGALTPTEGSGSSSGSGAIRISRFSPAFPPPARGFSPLGTEPDASFQAKNAQLYRLVVMAVAKCQDITAKRLATEKLCAIKAHDGKSAYEEIIKLHENPTQQNKLDAGRTFLALKLKPGETIEEYKLRASDNLTRIKRLDVNLEDLHTTIFIDGLVRSEFDQLKTTLYTQGNLSFDQAAEYAAAHSRRVTESFSRPKPTHLSSPALPPSSAFIATSSLSGGEDNYQLSGEEYALVASFRAASSKKRNGLDHDVDAHPDSPTDYEKTLTCDICHVKGHAKRTCRKRKAP